MRGLVDIAELTASLRRGLLFAAGGVVALGLGGAGVAVSLVGGSRPPALVAEAGALAPAAPQPAPEATPEFVVTTGRIAPGSTLASSLLGAEIDPRTIHEISQAMAPVFDFRHASAGDHYRLVEDAAGRIVDFWYSTSQFTGYHLFRDGERLVAERQEADLVRRTTQLAGVISTSLYEAVRLLGEHPKLAGDFAEVFAWDIDFSRAVRPGDDFAILYERLYRVGLDGREEYAGPGRVLAARYRGAAGTHQAVYFEPEMEDLGGYFRPDGTSVERQFLLAPLRYSRISSRFSAARRHPILKVTRPHHGVDYAAPLGTPIYAVAEGTVIYQGAAGGFGNLVKIRHGGGYVSYYAHMSRFARGLAVGSRVRQKQVVGYVGQSGLATGPHVCFRIARNGHYVNPSSLRAPAGRSVPSERMADFEVVRNALLGQLDPGPPDAGDEAL